MPFPPLTDSSDSVYHFSSALPDTLLPSLTQAANTGITLEGTLFNPNSSLYPPLFYSSLCLHSVHRCSPCYDRAVNKMQPLGPYHFHPLDKRDQYPSAYNTEW